jgi:hypothetical protein
MVGCSLDGDVDDFAGIVEIKCPKSATHLGYLKAKAVPPSYLPQILHNMWITGAMYCDFVSFDDRLPAGLQLVVVTVQRNDFDVMAYSRAAERFLSEVDAELETVRGLAVPA